jgi:outer membrane lipoprotein-sorting protein
MTPNGNVATQTTTYLQYPDHVRVETRGTQGELIQIYDGQRGWVRDPSGLHDVPAEALRGMAANLQRDTVSALLAADRGELRARRLPDVKDAEGVVRHALELSSPTVDPIVLHIDVKTGLVAKEAYVVRAPGQPLIEAVFSDYRAVDGVRVAFTTEVRADGKPVVKRRLSEIAINTSLDPRLFTRPGS